MTMAPFQTGSDLQAQLHAGQENADDADSRVPGAFDDEVYEDTGDEEDDQDLSEQDYNSLAVEGEFGEKF